MDPDNLQQAWQAQSSQTRITIDAGLLLKEVQRNQRSFHTTILRRDVIEVGVGLLMLPYWIYIGLTGSQPWTWWLTVPAIIWVVGYFLVDRVRHPQTPSDPTEPLLKCVKNSLTQVEHQIWLLRNVFWWYLLPFTISILIFFAHSAMLMSDNWLGALGNAMPFFVFLWGIYSFIDYINQLAVRKQLEPRRQELLTLHASLGGDDSADERATMSGVNSVESSSVLKRWLIVAGLTLVIYGVVLLIVASRLFNSHHKGPAKTQGPQGAWLGKLVTDTSVPKAMPSTDRAPSE